MDDYKVAPASDYPADQSIDTQDQPAPPVGDVRSDDNAQPQFEPTGDAKKANPQAPLEKLLEAANSVADEARSAYLTFGAFALYLLITVGATTHEQLLRGSIITMPLLGVDIPIVGFYTVVPFLFLLAHLNVLLHLSSLATALSNLRSKSADQWPSQEALLRPFSRFLLARFTEADLTRRLIRAVAFCSVVLLPLVVLLATQVRFLPYHSGAVAWWQRALVLMDLLILLLFWPRITCGGAARRSMRSLSAEQVAIIAVMVPFVVVMAASTVPDETLEKIVTSRPTLSSSASAEEPRSTSPRDLDHCTGLWRIWSYWSVVKLPYHQATDAGRRDMLCLSYLLFEQPETLLGMRRNLALTHADFVAARPSAELFTDAEDLSVWLKDEELRNEALKHFWQDAGRGVDLRGRDLRYADLSESDLRKADLRGADLQGAKLVNANLNYANFGDIQVGEVVGCRTQLDPSSGTCRTNLSLANLSGASVQFGSFWKALLDGTQLDGANLSQTQLSHADLHNSNMKGANLQGTNLDHAELDSALITGDLQEASVRHSHIGCAIMSSEAICGAKANGADLTCEGRRDAHSR